MISRSHGDIAKKPAITAGDAIQSSHGPRCDRPIACTATANPVTAGFGLHPTKGL
jgi:hypothetical protein